MAIPKKPSAKTKLNNAEVICTDRPINFEKRHEYIGLRPNKDVSI